MNVFLIYNHLVFIHLQQFFLNETHAVKMDWMLSSFAYSKMQTLHTVEHYDDFLFLVCVILLVMTLVVACCPPQYSPICFSVRVF